MNLKLPYSNPDLDGGSFSCQVMSTGVLLIHGFTATTVESGA